MRYIEEFREPRLAKNLLAMIQAVTQPHRTYSFMEFCGGHTHAIYRHGLPDVLPKNIDLIHGPGCPVCILPTQQIDKAICLAEQDKVILCCYADMLRVPGSSKQTLLSLRAQGKKIQMVYSVDDALSLAQNHPSHEIVFFAIGFETTTPPTACAILKAAAIELKNFSVFCNHVITLAAMGELLKANDISLQGIIGPAHVSMVIGSQAYQHLVQHYHMPIVISGFEPLDLLQSILWLILQVNEGRCEVENQYTRAVSANGNPNAQAQIAEVFELAECFEWRGLGLITHSGLKIKAKYAHYDAEHRFQVTPLALMEDASCQCGLVLRGKLKPQQCPNFAKTCTPSQPIGACMVSAEGACAALYRQVSSIER